MSASAASGGTACSWPPTRRSIRSTPTRRASRGREPPRSPAAASSSSARVDECDLARAILVPRFAGRKQVFEEEGRQLGPARQARLPVNGRGLLPDGRFAGRAEACDLLVRQALQHQHGDIGLALGEAPEIELLADSAAETV